MEWHAAQRAQACHYHGRRVVADRTAARRTVASNTKDQTEVATAREAKEYGVDDERQLPAASGQPDAEDGGDAEGDGDDDDVEAAAAVCEESWRTRPATEALR